MAKKPIPNKVKTRLIPTLSPTTAAKLYHNFLLDKIEQVNKITDAKPVIAYSPPSSKIFFKKIIPKGFTLIEQIGENLGERLSNISNMLFHQGFSKIILMDSDTPNLPSEYLYQAIKYLNQVDIVLGPCVDGGYYLIGSRYYFPDIFREIPWSTSKVIQATINKIILLGATFRYLDKWYDVDTIKDLIRLKHDLTSSNQKECYCKNTRKIISQINIGNKSD
jgi:rSAM/selenodomain-associated transferase 1